MGNAQLHLVPGGVEAPLGLACPHIVLCGAHEAAPVALVVKHKGVFVGSVVHELAVGAAAPIEIAGGIAVGAGGGNGQFRFGNRHGGGRRVGPVQVYLVALLAVAAYEHGEPLVLVESEGSGHLGNLAGLDVGLRILGQGIVVPVRALGAVVLHVLEPDILVPGVVHHVVHVDTDVVLVGLGYELLEVVQGAVAPVHRLIVGYVVAVIALGGLDRAEPQGGNAELVEVVQFGDQALEVSVAVPVAVLEAEHVHLVSEARRLCRW